MIVLGVDPGSRHTGFGVIDVDGNRTRVLGHGRISPAASLPLPQRLAELVGGLEEVLDRYSPALAAVERPFHGVSSSSLIVLAEARGCLLATLARRHLAIREYAPAQVKAALATGRADKEQVARVVGLLLGLDLSAVSADATDALAVALCCAQRRQAEAWLDEPRPGRPRARRVALTVPKGRATLPPRRT